MPGNQHVLISERRNMRIKACFSVLSPSAILVCALLFFMGADAHAQNLLVDCSGQNQQAYHSINDALANLPFQQSNVIQVTPATCHETVYMAQAIIAG